MAEKMFIEGDWEPYFSELARLTLEGAKDNDKVVLSHATGYNDLRDHVIKKLIEGGASEDKITIIQLTIDPKVKARGLYHRTARMAEQSGMTMTGKEVQLTFDLNLLHPLLYFILTDAISTLLPIHKSAAKLSWNLKVK